MADLIRYAAVAAGAAVVLAFGAFAPATAQATAAGAAGAAGGTAAGTRLDAGRDASGGTWGTAEEVPGTAALNVGPTTSFISVSCASAGNCSAGGDYTDSSGHQQAFVVSQVGGTWSTAEEVRGTAALNAGGFAQIDSVSCAAAGNCSAGGLYTDSTGHVQAFVVSQAAGAWGKAKEIPGTATLNAGGYAQVTSVSCAAAGSCSAGGYYANGADHDQVFVVSQAGGAWGRAKEVPGTATLNAGGYAQLTSVSCTAAGSCSAGGFYTGGADHDQAFVVSQAAGAWGKAKEVPGTATLNAGGNAQLVSVSCAAAGDCSAGGLYADSSGLSQAFVVSQAGGVWGQAEEVPGTAALNGGGHAGVYSLSCASAGNCSAGGTYQDGSGHYQTFVVSQT